ncbi:MAG: V-type ATPase subunit [Spirochaetaceae bacterium]|jgi:vacuolar-type H+-ATPase subunit C/Vma6|nr:V-type ATPase subunit [Spirochaetaceae bacterium]
MYAKACGIIGKSFVGRGLARLGPVTRLSELDRLVFPENPRDLPERELLVDLESRLALRAADRIGKVIDSFSKPPEFLVRLLRAYEYSDVKSCLNALIAGETQAPAHTGLGEFTTVTFAAYPDLRGMFRDSEFAWLCGETLSEATSESIQSKLDSRYYSALWKAMGQLAKKDRIAIEGILREEISLRNAAWALRLRTYYGMDGEAIRERLISIEPAGPPTDTLAVASLSLALDNRGEWQKWKAEGLLNPERPGEAWKVDPRYFQNAAAAHLYRMTYHALRRRPFSLDTAACFIKLMLFEEDYLTSVAEGLSLGMTAPDVFAILEAQP